MKYLVWYLTSLNKLQDKEDDLFGGLIGKKLLAMEMDIYKFLLEWRVASGIDQLVPSIAPSPLNPFSQYP